MRFFCTVFPHSDPKHLPPPNDPIWKWIMAVVAMNILLLFLI